MKGLITQYKNVLAFFSDGRIWSGRLHKCIDEGGGLPILRDVSVFNFKYNLPVCRYSERAITFPSGLIFLLVSLDVPLDRQHLYVGKGQSSFFFSNRADIDLTIKGLVVKRLADIVFLRDILFNKESLSLLKQMHAAIGNVGWTGNLKERGDSSFISARDIPDFYKDGVINLRSGLFLEEIALAA